MDLIVTSFSMSTILLPETQSMLFDDNKHTIKRKKSNCFIWNRTYSFLQTETNIIKLSFKKNLKQVK